MKAGHKKELAPALPRPAGEIPSPSVYPPRRPVQPTGRRTKEINFRKHKKIRDLSSPILPEMPANSISKPNPSQPNRPEKNFDSIPAAEALNTIFGVKNSQDPPPSIQYSTDQGMHLPVPPYLLSSPRFLIPSGSRYTSGATRWTLSSTRSWGLI